MELLDKVLLGDEKFSEKMDEVIAALGVGKNFTKSVTKDATGSKITVVNVIGGVEQAPFDFAGGGGGTSVVANPTLAGTEGLLNGLEVAGTKYKLRDKTSELNNDSGFITKDVDNLTNYIKLLGKEDVSQEQYHFTYYFEKELQATKIVVKAYTITLDNNKSKDVYTMDVDQATGSKQSTATDMKIGLLGIDDRKQIYKNKEDIELIELASDVKDVVAVYDRGTDTSKTDLAHYDIGTLTQNDIIKVLADESQTGEKAGGQSYYRYNGGTGSFPTYFTYIGTLSPSYSKTAADDTFIKYTGTGSKLLTGDLAFQNDATHKYTITGLKDPVSDTDAMPKKYTEDNFIKKLGEEEVSGEQYHFGYYYDIKPSATDYVIDLYTITLDNNKTKTVYSYTLPVAGTEIEIGGVKTKISGLMSAESATDLEALKKLGLSIVDGAINITYEA